MLFIAGETLAFCFCFGLHVVVGGDVTRELVLYVADIRGFVLA